MRTVIYQSYRTHNVPAWIATCIGTVRAWADQHGFDYTFYDDSFFDRVPGNLRARIGDNKCPLSDYARLVVARELLSGGYNRAIWIDADILVFDPANFHIRLHSGHAFCREVWLHRTILGRPQFKLTVNNSISVFCRGETIIDHYLDAARHIINSGSPIDTFSIGTDFLVALRRAYPFPLLNNVGIFSPEMAARYLDDDARHLRPYLAYQTAPIAAANLCLSKHSATTIMPDALVARLLADHGASLNRHYQRHLRHNTRSEFTRPISPYLALKETIHAAQHTLHLMRNANLPFRNKKHKHPATARPVKPLQTV